MKTGRSRAGAFLLLISLTAVAAGPQEALAGEGEAGWGGVRMPVDSVGYAIYPYQVEAVVRAAERLISAGPDRSGEPAMSPMIGGICPHDDYIYAGPAYVKLLSNIDVPLVVLVGVSHGARRIGVQGGLVFGSFRAWKGPWGDVPVSALREELQALLPPESFMIDDGLQAGEHSLEGLIPFIQYYRSGRGKAGTDPPEGAGRAAEDGPDIGGGSTLEILPVLTTRMAGESFDTNARAFADAMHEVMEKRGMRLGRDYAVVISADCVHYGDDQWGGRDYSPYGTGGEGYEAAVAEEKEIVGETLVGRVDGVKIKAFRDRIDSYEFEWPYKIPWCGVYSIPFGLSILERLCALEGREPPVGRMLDYSTSLDPGALDVGETGLGATNIATLRHWVGYTAVGYW
ncbi:MAG TPA: AmmeMemoRadiSam system protein B [Candidatus Krumholzibacterium sp.]|nr:AmmeMemoRadiSam system protein B [Candidatus Krumholzibacterium sp.]